MVKRLLTIFLSILIVLSLVACSGKGEETATDEATTTTKTPTTTTAAPTTTAKNYTLSIGLPGSYEVTSQEIVDSFIAKYPNVEVTIYDEAWHPFSQSIELKVEAGAAPDVWFQENAVILGFGARGYCEDLAPLIAKDLNAADFIDTLFVAKDGEKVWGVPHGANPIALAYNKGMFDAAGEPYPTDDWTFDDMIAAAKRLTYRKNPEDVNASPFGFITSPNMTQGWYAWIKSTGGSCLDETKTKATFTDSKTIQGIKNWADSYLVQKISPSRASVSYQAFGEGKGAMYFMQYSEAPTVNSEYANIDYDCAMIPKASDGNRYVINVSNTWTINKAATDDSKEAAWLWLQHYLSEESQEILAKAGATLPIRLSSMDKLDTSSKPLNKAAFYKGIEEYGTPMDENPTWNAWRKAANGVLETVMDGFMTAEDACAQIQESVQSILDADLNK
ncbi:MAG: sugar ABC transporter substrate-binding protein [Eubacteriales bacterium]|nr:sugar ABC transporter substrate-binding protein [Eubacteriales bacterium]